MVVGVLAILASQGVWFRNPFGASTGMDLEGIWGLSKGVIVLSGGLLVLIAAIALVFHLSDDFSNIGFGLSGGGALAAGVAAWAYFFDVSDTDRVAFGMPLAFVAGSVALVLGTAVFKEDSRRWAEKRQARS